MLRLAIVALMSVGPALAADPPSYPNKTDLLLLKDSTGKESPITTAKDWATKREHILQNMQIVMGPMPADSKKVPLDPKEEEETDCGAYRRFKMSIAVEK